VLDLVVVLVLAGDDPRLCEDDSGGIGGEVGGDDEAEAEEVFGNDRACHRCLLVLAGLSAGTILKGLRCQGCIGAVEARSFLGGA